MRPRLPLFLCPITGRAALGLQILLPRKCRLYLSTTPTHHTSPKANQLPPRPKAPPEEEIEESYVKGSGPGGQKINKTNSAVQLKHTPTGLIVKSQATRSRTENRKIARKILALKLDELRNGENSRVAVVSAFKKKKSESADKKKRRKYRKLEEEKALDESEEGDEKPKRRGGRKGFSLPTQRV